MKKLLLLSVLLLMTPSLFAYDKLIPKEIKLENLPENSRIIFKKSILFSENNHEIWNREFDFGDNSGVVLLCKIDKDYTINSMTIISRIYIKNDSHININFESGKCKIQITKEYTVNNFLPTTVSQLDLMIGDYIKLVYDDPDPYPGMDKSVATDIVMKKITNAIQTKDYKNALVEFAFLEKMGGNLPESFYYYYTEALDKTGNKVETKTRALDYLKKYGKSGKYYANTVEILSRQ